MMVEVCAACGYSWKSADETQEEREPCQMCGSVARKFSEEVNDSLMARDSIAGKVIAPTLPSRKKVRVEHFDGWEWSETLGKKVKKSRTIDRRKNEYHERVEDPDTGEFIHECREPLTNHRGHGSDKVKREKDDE